MNSLSPQPTPHPPTLLQVAKLGEQASEAGAEARSAASAGSEAKRAATALLRKAAQVGGVAWGEVARCGVGWGAAARGGTSGRGGAGQTPLRTHLRP